MKKYILILFSFSLLFSSCDNSESPAFIIRAEDNGKTFNITAGSYFRAVFNECSGCPAIWEISEIDLSRLNVLKEYSQNFSCCNCAGGSHEAVFEILAKAAGQSDLTFTLFDTTISVTINVE